MIVTCAGGVGQAKSLLCIVFHFLKQLRRMIPCGTNLCPGISEHTFANVCYITQTTPYEVAETPYEGVRNWMDKGCPTI